MGAAAAMEGGRRQLMIFVMWRIAIPWACINMMEPTIAGIISGTGMTIMKPAMWKDVC